MKLQQKGFSLVQTLVAVGLTGILGLIIMKNQETSSKMKAKTDANEVLAQATHMIQKALNDRATCSLSLQNLQTGEEVTKIVKAQASVSDYNAFIPTGGNVVEKGVPLPGDVVVDYMSLINDSGVDYLEVTFNLDAKGRKSMAGAEKIKKRFQLQVAKTGPTIGSCYSETDNLIETTAIESCKALHGTMVNGKCEFIQQLVDTTSVNCGEGASYRTEIVNGKIKLTCTPCTMVRKFSRWDCEKKMPGMNWINVCYYKTGCTNNPAIAYGLEFWEKGGTSASGGDTGTKNNCKEKRHKCFGE